jgi:hypothetical protein
MRVHSLRELHHQHLNQHRRRSQTTAPVRRPQFQVHLIVRAGPMPQRLCRVGGTRRHVHVVSNSGLRFQVLRRLVQKSLRPALVVGRVQRTRVLALVVIMSLPRTQSQPGTRTRTTATATGAAVQLVAMHPQLLHTLHCRPTHVALASIATGCRTKWTRYVSMLGICPLLLLAIQGLEPS